MTRLIEVLISLAIVAALFLVISLVLPSSRHLSEKVETNRKATIVYDTLNSLRRFKDWNPLVLRDPRMPTAPATMRVRAAMIALACCRCSIAWAISGA